MNDVIQSSLRIDVDSIERLAAVVASNLTFNEEDEKSLLNMTDLHRRHARPRLRRALQGQSSAFNNDHLASSSRLDT